MDDLFDATDIRERVIWVIDEFVGTSHKFAYLENRTGISARKWKNLYNRVQQPSTEMIAALATYRPYFLSWMVCGSAKNAIQVDPTTATWVEDLLRYQTQGLYEILKEKNGDKKG
ncbi:hypothetical protein BH11PSE12_BH11PSE12_20710 [soil metagenome]